MKRTFDVIVLGGGAIGAATACALVDAGLDVALLDRKMCGGEGPTAHSGGIVRRLDPDAAIRALYEFVSTPGKESTLRTTFEASVRRVGVAHLTDEQGYAALAGEVRKTSHPDIEIVGGWNAAISEVLGPIQPTEMVVIERSGGISDVRAFVRKLCKHVKEQGTLLENVCVHGYSSTESLAAVRVGSVTFQAKVVVDACGASAPDGRPTGLVHARTIPFTRYFATAVPAMPVLAHEARTYVLPIGKGLAQSGGQVRHSAARVEDLELDFEANERDVMQRLSHIGIDLQHVEPISTTISYDSYTADGRPVIGFTDAAKTQYIASGFCGIGYKLAPAVGELVAEEIVTHLWGRDVDARHAAILEQFSPTRNSLSE